MCIYLFYFSTVILIVYQKHGRLIFQFIIQVFSAPKQFFYWYSPRMNTFFLALL